MRAPPARCTPTFGIAAGKFASVPCGATSPAVPAAALSSPSTPAPPRTLLFTETPDKAGGEQFIASGQGYGVTVTPTQAGLDFGQSTTRAVQAGGQGPVVTMQLVGANPSAAASGIGAVSGASPGFARVQYAGVYSGIDLNYHGAAQQGQRRRRRSGSAVHGHRHGQRWFAQRQSDRQSGP